MKSVGLATFTKEVMDSEVPVFVKFGAEFCQPCKTFEPVLQSVASDKLKVVSVDITDETELTEHFDVTNIPTTILFKDGKVVAKVVGLKSKKELLNLVKTAV